MVGFGGYKIFTGRQGQVASKPDKAARGAKRQVQVESYNKIHTGSKLAPRHEPYAREFLPAACGWL